MVLCIKRLKNAKLEFPSKIQTRGVVFNKLRIFVINYFPLQNFRGVGGVSKRLLYLLIAIRLHGMPFLQLRNRGTIKAPRKPLSNQQSINLETDSNFLGKVMIASCCLILEMDLFLLARDSEVQRKNRFCRIFRESFTEGYF